jgi:hypothetical protein
MLSCCTLISLETSTSYLLAGCLTVYCMLILIRSLENDGWYNIQLKLKFVTFET